MPSKLTKLVDDYGPHLTAGHLASALAVLAGLITGKAMPESKVEAEYRRPARRCAELMRAKVGEATHIDCARWVEGCKCIKLHIAGCSIRGHKKHWEGTSTCFKPCFVACTCPGKDLCPLAAS